MKKLLRRKSDASNVEEEKGDQPKTPPQTPKPRQEGLTI
jgi:hypothetical protein